MLCLFSMDGAKVEQAILGMFYPTANFISLSTDFELCAGTAL